MDLVIQVARFDIHLVRLDPAVGAEIQKTRPCMVVSPDSANRILRTVIVAPMTTTIRSFPTRMSIRFRREDGQVALDQLRVVDKSRLLRRLGAADRATAAAVASKLVEMFAL